jgi:hypothetical protein
MKTLGLSLNDQAIAEQLKQKVSAKSPLYRLIVFGSRARGDHDSDSDLDVLVILQDTASAADRRAVSDCAWEVSIQFGILITPVIYSRWDWETGPESASLLALAVKEEGVII